MTLKNRETIQRAVGIIEGASWGAKQSVQEALELAIELLDSVLDDEAKTRDFSSIGAGGERK